MIFKVFGVYLSEFLIFLHEIFFGSKILPSSCDKHQKFDHGCSRYPGNEAQSPDFGYFRRLFRDGLFGSSLQPTTVFFLKKHHSNICTFKCSKRFLMAIIFELIIC